MAVEDLKQSPMMNNMLEALDRGEDIGHYGRLTFAMVARYFVDNEELVQLLTKDGDTAMRTGPGLWCNRSRRGAITRTDATESWNGRSSRILRSARISTTRMLQCIQQVDLLPDGLYEDIQQYREEKPT